MDRLLNLQTLYLSNNHIEELPEGLGRAPVLIDLDLRVNKIRTIPTSFKNFKEPGLKTSQHPLEEPLNTLLQQGYGAVITYLTSLDDGIPQYEAKVLVVGEGEVGKSSLLAALRRERFIENRSTTHGIEIGELALPHPTINQKIRLNTWDFGGQEIYRITHQFFFGRRCLYILAWNPRQGREANEVEGWIKRIRLRVGSEARIIIVSTHADIRRSELDYPALRHQFGPILESNHEIDSLSRAGIPEFEAQLARSAATLPQMGELLNKNWADVGREILSLSCPHITYDEFLAICAAHGLNEQETPVLAALLHDLGHIVHYADDDGLREIVVLQAEWLTKAIGFVLEDLPTRDGGGVLEHRRLREIWTDELGYPTKYHPYFLRLMEKFDVSYRLSDRDASLVGQLVPYAQPESIWSRHEAGDRTLELVCVMKEEAPGLIAWLTVRNNRFSLGKHWRRGVVLRHDRYQSEALFTLLDERTLVLSVRAPSPDYFFSILRDSLEELIHTRWPGLEYEIQVPCGEKPDGVPCRGRFPYRQLQKHRERNRTEIDCMECFTPHNVSELLTGFGLATTSISDALDEFRASVDLGLKRIEAYAADSAGHVRAALRAIASESAESPRLFSLRPKEPSVLGRMAFWQQEMILTLWCEHPGSEHPCTEGDYRLHASKEWFADAAPYLRLVLRTLTILAPVATWASAEFLSKDAGTSMKDRIKLMEALVAQLPEGSPDTLADLGPITAAEGASLRQVQALLFKIDPEKRWGDLRRKLTVSGDYVWVCPEHYQIYDPGLPSLPS